MNNQKIREKIFKIYSDNFQFIVDNTNLKDSYNQEYGYYCPLCTKHFTKKKLLDKTLTIEHNPPKSLGGKGTILTCRECNSRFGHSFDVELLNALKLIDKYSFKPNSEIKTRFQNEHTGDEGVNAKINIDNEGKFIININSNNNNPRIYEKFFNSAIFTYHNPLLTQDIEKIGLENKLTFNFTIPGKLNKKIINNSLLKIAYLIGFEKLGYIFLFNKNMQIVRKQLDNPNTEIIKAPFWFKYDFPDENLGINIITKPRELKSFLIIFDLTTKSDKYRLAVIIPGLGQNDDKIYEVLSNMKNTNPLNIELNNFINYNYDIKKIKETFKLVYYWEEIIEKTY